MKIFSFLLFAAIILTVTNSFADSTCVRFPGLSEEAFVRPTLANQVATSHFIIHWENPTTLTYAQNTANYAEYAYQEMCVELGWLVPPADDGRGGDNKYDIYLVDKSYIDGSNGITQPEIIGNWTYEWSPSFVLIRNNILTFDTLQIITAHEFNHALQLAYTCKDGSTDTWFLENTAVWMAEVIYNGPPINYYLRYFYGPDYDKPDPLDSPQFGIHTSWGDGLGWYNYAGFLWPKFLAEWTGDDAIVRKIWQRLGQNPGDHILSDINYILSGLAYESSLNEAARYYAEWRYFTGIRDDGMHFVNAIDLPTSTIFITGQALEIDGFGGTKFIQLNPSEEMIEINFNGDNNVVWSANIIEHKYEPPSLNKSITLNSFYDGTIEAITEDCEAVVLTPILLTDITKKYFTYSANMFDARKVFFYNKKGTTFADGNLKLDDLTTIPSGGSKWLRYNSTPHNIKTLNERYIENPIYKHNNWNAVSNKYFLNKDFTVQDYGNDHNANFIPLVPTTISNVIEGISVNDYGTIWFNDPWYVKDANDTQSGMDDFLEFPSPYNPTGKYNVTTGGVFLNQGGTGFTPPYYSVKADAEQLIPINGQNRKFYFLNWGGTEVQFQNSNLLETGVVFKDEIPGEDPDVQANLKGQLMSNTTTGISSNSQRKICRTDNGIYHVVYESMGSVFYTHSLTSNFDGEWAPDQIVYDNAKNPAIEYDGNIVKIVLEYYDPVYSAQVDLWLLSYELEANGRYENFDAEVFATCPSSYFGYAKPVISYNNGQIVLVYRKNSTEGLKERTKWYYPTPGTWVWSNENTIPETDANSINPAVAEKYGHIHIAFESLSTIKYKFGYIMSTSWHYSPIVNLSTGSGFGTNIYPSISLSNAGTSYVMVSWLGIHTNAAEKKLYKETAESNKRYAAVSKVGYGTSWGGFSNFSNYVKYTSSGTLNSSAGSILAWSESNGQTTKYVKRKSNGTYDPITSLLFNSASAKGIHTLVSNGSGFDNIKVMVFNALAPAPYLLNKCTNEFSEIPLSKVGETETIDISYGRSGVVEKNGVEFLFSIGDVLLNDQTINFVERIDTLPVANLEELNSIARTELFNLNTQSELIFSNYYYVVNGDKADSVLTDQFNVTFKCELVNAATSQVVGTFDDVTYNKLNVQEYNNQSYLIDCSGIETGNYYLKLTTAVNDSVNLFISDIQRDDIVLEKSKLLVRNFKGEGIPTVYDLEQNFPNPFNPSTAIRYQLPQDGMVTLKIYDILGSEVTTLVNEEKAAGKYEVNFNALSLASGVYIYKIQAGDYINSKKMILLK